MRSPRYTVTSVPLVEETLYTRVRRNRGISTTAHHTVEELVECAANDCIIGLDLCTGDVQGLVCCGYTYTKKEG